MFSKYYNAAFFKEVHEELLACQDVLYNAFTKRFSEADVSILWTSLLNPQYNLNSSHWRDEEEKEKAKTLLKKEAILVEQKGNV